MKSEQTILSIRRRIAEGPTMDALRRMAAMVRPARLRTIGQFAEQEIILPTGPYAGQRYRIERNPFVRLWFDALQFAKHRRFVALGPQQTGKTLNCWVIPIMYHLFELNETVIGGLPSLDMVSDKWTEDLLPVIERSRYRELLPKHGPGSRGGDVTRVQFRNGVTLRFMTGGGADKARAGFTSRVVAITETDGMDLSGGSSREADKITQLEGRTRAYADRARIYMECTVSIEAGRTWREYTAGTQSRIAIACPHCGAFVCPEREHLIGWDGAKDEVQAADESHFVCPSCGAMWTEADRRAAHQDMKLVHRGQEIAPDGSVTGGEPRTATLGFRWTATNNLLVPASLHGMAEWKARQLSESQRENAERELCQFVWAIPHKQAEINLTGTDPAAIARRVTTDPQGRVPAGTRWLTLGIDLGKYRCYWTALAWRPGATPHVIEYGYLQTPVETMAVESAILLALREFRDTALARGWESDDGLKRPDLVLVDEGDWPEVGQAFALESQGMGLRAFTAKGFGERQVRSAAVGAVRQTGTRVLAQRDGYAIVRYESGITAVHANADHWKSWVHARLATPLGQPGALTLHYLADPGREHLTFARHMTAERKIEEFVAGKGLVVKWVRQERNNHWLDATCLASLAGYEAGARLVGEEAVGGESAKTQSEGAGAGMERVDPSDLFGRGR